MFKIEDLYDICLAQFCANKYMEKHKEKKVDWTFYLPERVYKEQLETLKREKFNQDVEKAVTELNQEFVYVYEYKDDEKTVKKYKGEIMNKVAFKLNEYLIRM